MKLLEREPLTEHNGQSFLVDGKVYHRRYGEKEFQEQKPTEDTIDDLERVRDSLDALPLSTEYDVCIDLRDPEHFEFTTKLVGPLDPSDTSGFYHGKITRGDIGLLSRQGIKMKLPNGPFHRCAPSQPDDSQGNTVRDGDRHLGVSSGHDRGNYEIFFDNMEANFEAKWNVGRVWYPPYDTWGLSSYRKATGSYSLWCAGSEITDNGGPYLPLLMGYLITDPKIDVSGYSRISFNFQTWYDTDPFSTDLLTVQYSHDGSYWFWADQFQGFSGWDYKEYDINFYDSLWIKFYFQSSSDPQYMYCGAYIDDVHVWGFIPEYNFSWLPAPSGWDAPVVVSNSPGHNQNETVYANEPIYIDLAVINTGIDTSYYTNVYLLIDDTVQDVFSVGSIPPGEHSGLSDWVCTLSAGSHHIHTVIDTFNILPETNENDNTYDVIIDVQDRVVFTGSLYYQDSTPPYPSPLRPMRQATIEIWDDDDYSPDDLLATVTSNNDGYFSFPPLPNEDVYGTLDPYFRIYAENDAAWVTSVHQGDTYVIETPYVNDISGGQYDTAFTASAGESGYFFVADKIKDARDGWIDLSGSSGPPKVEVVLNGDSGTYYLPGADYIHIDTSAFNTWDYETMMHEYGHKIEHTFNFFDTGAGGEHNWTMLLSPEDAAREGFAHFFGCALKQYHVFYSPLNNFSDTSWWNIENGEYGYNDNTYGSANHFPNREASVGGILWDIYDDVDDDYSIYGLTDSDWDPDTGYGQDGIGDNLSDGVTNILTVLLDRTVGGHHPDNITEFFSAWFADPSLGQCQAMKNIWYEHGEIVGTREECCCWDRHGNVDGDSNDNCNIADMTYLVAYLFSSGPVPLCMEEADINGNTNGPNIQDLTFLAAYLFEGGATPPLCP